MKFVLLLFNLIIVISVYSQQQNGYVKFYYPNGKVSSEGFMVNNKPDKFWKTFYPTGVLKSEGKRLNYLLDSIWIFYAETGDTIEKITFKEGKKNGFSYKYSTQTDVNKTISNITISKELYINDLKEGTGFYYFTDGNLKETIVFKNNKRHGEAKEYDRKGSLITIYSYFNDFLTEKQTLNRVQNNVPVGIWRDYYSNGTLKSEKTYKDGELNGYVKEFDEKGNLRLNQLYNTGKIVSLSPEDTIDIEEKLTFFDNKKIKTRNYYKNGLPVGIHREYDNNGNVISSMIYDNFGILTGSGIIKDDGTREGKFTWFHDNGAIKSEGVYRDNRQVGKWQFYFKNRSLEQEGTFNNGYFNGAWTWFYPDSSVLRVENFINGKRNGLFVEFTPLGDTLVSGYYTNDLKNGMWKYNSGDVIELGNYTNDLREGIWKSYYANGNLHSKGNFIEGNPDGNYYFYYENKIIKEEQFYVNGIKERVWKKYNPDGTLFISILYQSNIETRVNGYKLAIIK